MHKIIVYLDDPVHAQQQLPAAGPVPTHWVLVACAPRMTHRVSKWVSHSARENWRAKWADKLFGQVVPPLRERGDAVTPVLARGPLPELTRLLMEEHGTEQLLDVRRPRSPDGPSGDAGWSRNAALGMASLLVLAAD